MAIAHSIPAFTPKQIDRFWSHVLKLETGCWEWQQAPDSRGYGRFWLGGKTYRAHRVAYELIRQTTIPLELPLDHLCRNTRCVNPDHLEIVTYQVNALRGIGAAAAHAQQTHCIHGHPLSGDNLRIDRGFRRCRTCVRRWGAEARAKRKGSGICVSCAAPSETYRCEPCAKSHSLRAQAYKRRKRAM